jgi:hypothetical protein
VRRSPPLRLPRARWRSAARHRAPTNRRSRPPPAQPEHDLPAAPAMLVIITHPRSITNTRPARSPSVNDGCPRGTGLAGLRRAAHQLDGRRWTSWRTPAQFSYPEDGGEK